MKNINGFWEDDAGNKWTAENFSYTVALEHSKTLDNCFHCIDCVNCSNSDLCIECYNCEDCFDCFDCTECTYCSNCENCYGESNIKKDKDI